jgi:hypothetical protein
MSDSSYSELAQQTKNLASYRSYREAAETRRDEAVAEEEANIRHETERIEAVEARIRELVAELGLT